MSTSLKTFPEAITPQPAAIQRPLHAIPSADEPFSTEMIQNLIKAAELADRDFCNDIETLLTRVGVKALPELMNGLTAEAMPVRSLCAMVIIRLGNVVIEPMKHFYALHVNNSAINWSLELILEELGVNPADALTNVLPLERAI